jgi:hypothetical protein
MRRSPRWYAVASLGPVTVVAGLVWAFLQPYRITFLHPAGQGFWWLLVEPPLWVIAVGIFFHLAVARALAREIGTADEGAPALRQVEEERRS